MFNLFFAIFWGRFGYTCGITIKNYFGVPPGPIKLEPPPSFCASILVLKKRHCHNNHSIVPPTIQGQKIISCPSQLESHRILFLHLFLMVASPHERSVEASADSIRQPSRSQPPTQRIASQRFARAMPGPEARAVPCPLCNEKFFPAWAPGEQGGKNPMEVLGQGSY